MVGVAQAEGLLGGVCVAWLVSWLGCWRVCLRCALEAQGNDGGGCSDTRFAWPQGLGCWLVGLRWALTDQGKMGGAVVLALLSPQLFKMDWGGCRGAHYARPSGSGCWRNGLRCALAVREEDEGGADVLARAARSRPNGVMGGDSGTGSAWRSGSGLKPRLALGWARCWGSVVGALVLAPALWCWRGRDSTIKMRWKVEGGGGRGEHKEGERHGGGCGGGVIYLSTNTFLDIIINVFI